MDNTIPIYNQILTNLPSDIVITPDDKKSLVDDILSYDDTHELVFAIIRFYQINNSNNISNVPFYAKYLKTKGGYKFDLDNIPDKLIKILLEFFVLHKKAFEIK